MLDRPLLDIAVEIELDPDGRLLVRPTESAPRIDLKPFEEIGCANMLALEDAARAGLAAIGGRGRPVAVPAGGRRAAAEGGRDAARGRGCLSSRAGR